MALTQVSTSGIKDATVATADIADDAVTTAKIAAGNITATELGSDSVTGAKIAAGAINNANKIQDSIITGAKVGSGTITDGNLATNSVTTGKIANDAVTVDKVADDAIGVAQLSASGTASSSTFLRGDNSWTAVTSTTINNNADNRLITGSGTANTLEGEAGLTWNGSLLKVDTSGVEDCFRIGTSAGTDTAIRLGSTGTNADTHAVIKYDKDDNWLSMLVSGESHGAGGILIANGGNVGINAGTNPLHKLHVKGDVSNIIVAKQTTNNGGYNTFAGVDSFGNVKFYATHNGRVGAADGIIFGSDTAAANILDDYEEGTWTPSDASGAGLSLTNNYTATYTKIGRLVHLTFDVSYPSTSNTNDTQLGSLPFNQDVRYGTGVVGWTNKDNANGVYCHIGSGNQIYLMDNSGANSSGGAHLDNNEASGFRFIGSATYFAAT